MGDSKKFCDICKRNVSSSNFVFHYISCKTKTKLCERCNAVVLITRFKEHEDEYHSMVPCEKCNLPLEKCMLSKHQYSCSRRLVQCEFCYSKIPFKEYPEHKLFCGYRTEKCIYCQKCIMMKAMNVHCKEHEREIVNCIKCPVCEVYVLVKDIEIHQRSHESKRCHNKKDEQKGIEEKEDLMKKDKTTGEVAEKCPKLTGVDKLLEDLKNLLSTEEDSDVSIMVKDREFKAHRSILRIRSSVFNSMFKHDMTEKSSGTVEIVDCDPEAFQKFLQYLYTGHVEDLSNEIVLNLYFVANKYDAEEVKEKCVEFMKQNLSVETFYDVVTLSLGHSESALLETATEFFCKNVKEIIVTAQWQSFLKENTVAANELHIKALENYVIPK